MTAAALKSQPQGGVSEAARQLGKLGGRPKGTFSPLGRWLRNEIKQRSREGYGCREAFAILRDTEKPDGRDAFLLTDWPANRSPWSVRTRTCKASMPRCGMFAGPVI